MKADKIEKTCSILLPDIEMGVISGMFMLSVAMFLGALGTLSIVRSEGGHR